MSHALQESHFIQPPGRLPFPMAHSEGSGLPLLKAGSFGADLVRFEAGRGVAEHTHPGAHMLFVVGGTGWLDYDGKAYFLSEGTCYYVPGGVRHAIRAAAELSLLSVADDHRPVDSPARLEITPDA